MLRRSKKELGAGSGPPDVSVANKLCKGDEAKTNVASEPFSLFLLLPRKTMQRRDRNVACCGGTQRPHPIIWDFIGKLLGVQTHTGGGGKKGHYVKWHELFRRPDFTGACIPHRWLARLCFQAVSAAAQFPSPPSNYTKQQSSFLLGLMETSGNFLQCQSVAKQNTWSSCRRFYLYVRTLATGSRQRPGLHNRLACACRFQGRGRAPLCCTHPRLCVWCLCGLSCTPWCLSKRAKGPFSPSIWEGFLEIAGMISHVLPGFPPQLASLNYLCQYQRVVHFSLSEHVTVQCGEEHSVSLPLWFFFVSTNTAISRFFPYLSSLPGPAPPMPWLWSMPTSTVRGRKLWCWRGKVWRKSNVCS